MLEDVEATVAGKKTYWHLLPLKRMPSEYEIVTSKLHYYTERGFEVATPIGDWYLKYQVGSPLACSDWERFRDPRETTYSKYTRLQRDKEAFVQGLLATIDGTSYDPMLPPAWVSILKRVFAPFRYPCHALQMLAAYVGQMAPSGRITVAALFQSADEMRRVDWLAYRLRLLDRAWPGLASGSRQAWESDPLWQPLRKTVERLLVAFDWGECFVGLNLVLKPILEELAMVHFGRLGRRHGDDVLERTFQSLHDDCLWHREWTRALVETVLADSSRNRDVLGRWVSAWQPLALEAAEAFRPVFEELPAPEARESFDEVREAVQGAHRAFLRSAGLETR